MKKIDFVTQCKNANSSVSCSAHLDELQLLLTALKLKFDIIGQFQKQKNKLIAFYIM